MKKIFLLCLTSLIILSCSNNKANDTTRDKAIADSINQDSINRSEAIEDSLSLIAWGDTRFGMTKQEVMKSKAFSGDKESVSETGYDSYSMPFEKLFEFERQNGLKQLCSIEAQFSENELHRIEIKSYTKDAAYLDDMINDCNVFISQFSQKYGAPSSKYEGELHSYDFEGSSDTKNLAIYTIGSKGDKGIIIKIHESDFEYTYTIEIFNADFPKKRHVDTKEEIEQQKKENKLQQDVSQNSF